MHVKRPSFHPNWRCVPIAAPHVPRPSDDRYLTQTITIPHFPPHAPRTVLGSPTTSGSCPSHMWLLSPSLRHGRACNSDHPRRVSRGVFGRATARFSQKPLVWASREQVERGLARRRRRRSGNCGQPLACARGRPRCAAVETLMQHFGGRAKRCVATPRSATLSPVS